MKKVVLAILDGVGISKNDYGNAYKLANTKTLDYLKQTYSNSKLKASGLYVGLPDGQMGNSEVGHITIGSGRTVDQPLTMINKSIEDGSFYSNEEFLKVINYVKEKDSKLHILGLLSDGGVHSHINHIKSLIDLAKKEGIYKLYLHVFLDGRDTMYNSALKYLDEISSYMEQKGIGKIATISGRYYAMDREGMWDKTKEAYDVIINNYGDYCNDYKLLIEKSYESGIYDEFVKPTIINKAGVIEDFDGLILANYRPDRIPQLFSAITNSEFNNFDIKPLKNIKLVTMMPVSSSVICRNAFKHNVINNTLGEVLANNNYKVLRIAEYSKYPHVTHFFDGDRDLDLKNTKKIKIPRVEVETYDLAPEMSAKEVTEKIVSEIENYDFIVVNYANGDMVGHTGNLDAAIKAIECIDDCLNKLYDVCKEKDYTLIITADHGNLEEMLDSYGNILTNHTTNDVEFILCDSNYFVVDGSLRDIAPTILDYLHINKPEEMSGTSLLKKEEYL